MFNSLILLVLLVLIHIGIASEDCPSTKCDCVSKEVASRIEVKVTCDGQQHNGYVPVFQKFSKPISVLNLYRSELTNIGNETFKALSYVRELYLNDNFLSNIEPHSFKGIDRYLEVLDLQHNRLTDLRFLTTHDFTSLRELLLRDNQLTTISLDSFAFVPSLESLILDENKIGGKLTFLKQPALIGLSHLNLDANQLTRIDPDDFVNLRNLRSLLVNRNSLSDLNFLSNHTFKRLYGLGAAFNRISEVPSELLDDKHLLKWLDLSYNYLSEANFTTSCGLRALQEIYLSNNLLTLLPDDAFRATSSLTMFTVAGNRLTSLPRCALLKFYQRMDTFDISNNPLQCDCALSWLHSAHTIGVEKHSQCSNIEFSDTLHYNTASCLELPVCTKLSKCEKKINVIYAGITGKVLSEYSRTTSKSGAARTYTSHLSSVTLMSLTVIINIALFNF